MQVSTCSLPWNMFPHFLSKPTTQTYTQDPTETSASKVTRPDEALKERVRDREHQTITTERTCHSTQLNQKAADGNANDSSTDSDLQPRPLDLLFRSGDQEKGRDIRSQHNVTEVKGWLGDECLKILIQKVKVSILNRGDQAMKPA